MRFELRREKKANVPWRHVEVGEINRLDGQGSSGSERLGTGRAATLWTPSLERPMAPAHFNICLRHRAGGRTFISRLI